MNAKCYSMLDKRMFPMTSQKNPLKLRPEIRYYGQNVFFLTNQPSRPSLNPDYFYTKSFLYCFLYIYRHISGRHKFQLNFQIYDKIE